MEKNEKYHGENINHDKNVHKEIVVDEDSIGLDSFRSYPSSNDNTTKIVDGEKVVEDFHLYKEDTDRK